MAIFNETDALYFATVTDAINASSAGDVLRLPAGQYVEEFPLITHSLTLQGVGGMAWLKNPNPAPANDRAVLMVPFNAGADLTLRNIEISGAARPIYQNGAGVLFETGYISNSDDAAYLNSAAGREAISQAAARAVRAYFARQSDA